MIWIESAEEMIKTDAKWNIADRADWRKDAAKILKLNDGIETVTEVLQQTSNKKGFKKSQQPADTETITIKR